jgi:very-short-patch-repair endonuclease
MAAVLATGPDAVLSHSSAAALWGIRSNRRGPIDVTSPSKTKPHGGIRRHEGRRSPDETTVHDGIPVTTVPRTIFDLAGDSPQAVEPALRQAEYLRLHDSLSLLDLLDRYPGHRGNRAIRAALARLKETPGRTRSDFEERFVAFLDRYRLPRPHFNAWIQLESNRFQVDCLWPDRRLIVELDSWSAHGTRAAFRSDKARDRKLAVAGYTTTRIPWSALDDEPDAIAADLRALLTDPQRNHT